MKRKTSIIIIIILVIMLIAIGIFMFGEINKGSSSKPTSTNILKEDDKITNQITNTIIENTITNEMENNITSENVIENTIPTETFEETPKTAEEKAISIVKKDWGEDKNVDIAIDGIDSNGNYIVAVRDSSTTEAKAFYIVNTSNGTFTKREMN